MHLRKRRDSDGGRTPVQRSQTSDALCLGEPRAKSGGISVFALAATANSESIFVY